MIYDLLRRPVWDAMGYVGRSAVRTPTPVPNLGSGACAFSLDTAHRLCMQTDGNLVVYGPRGAVWSPLISSPGAFLRMQGDGNLVVYAKDGRPLWHTGTFHHPGAQAVLDERGTLRVVAGGRTVWST